MSNYDLISIEGNDESINLDELILLIQKEIDSQLNDKDNKIKEISDLRYDFNIELVKKIILQRKKYKWTQQKLAEVSKVNRTTIAKLESFQRFVNLDVALKLLNALDLKLCINEKEIRKYNNEKKA